MLEIQLYRIIGQALQHAVQYLIDTSVPLHFHNIYSPETPNTITVSLRPTIAAKRLVLKRQISLLDYRIIEILRHYVHKSLSIKTLSTATNTTNSCVSSLMKDFGFWSDEQAYTTLQRFIKISAQCADHGPEPTNYAHANEYLILVLQKMATTGFLFPM
ncbi:unnamed protein product [Rotaria magnacalcarata]|uniref:Uncharacterized protein n=2 Tax=Rotaria magnacalcarata TaxID=392030 RepID=A0A816QBI1_9BILA|nr:unnamed protein product [Rotaria magnacalcarata]